MDVKLVENGVKTTVILKRISWFMYFCSLSADVLVMSLGLYISWFSPALPKLMSKNPDENPLGTPISSLQVSIITVLPIVGSIIMYPFWAKILDKIGRKTTMRIVGIILICNLVTTAYARNIIIYYICLPITAITVNGALLSVSVYNTEISEDSNRGKLTCLMAMNLPIGLLLGYTFGSFTDIKYSTLLSTLPPIIFLFASPFLPESPYYLLLNKNNMAGIKALETLRGTNNPLEIELECKKIKEIIASTVSYKSRTIVDIFSNYAIRRAFFLTMLITIIEQLSGISIILGYVSLIFNKAHSGLSGDSVGILVGVIKLGSFLIATQLTDKMGRRKLVLISTFFTTFPMLLLGFYFYCDEIGLKTFSNIRWIAILCIVIYIISYSIGLGNVPLTFAGEVFPEDLRAFGVSLMLIVNQITLCIILFAFPLVSNYYGVHWCFWIFGMCCFIGFIGLYFTFPETKGKTFLEIQHIFLSKTFF